MGQRGLRLSLLVLSQHDSARTVFCNSVARGETSSLKGHLAAWRRWKTFGRKFMPEPFDATHESLEATYAFLEDQAPRGPTVARSLFQQLLWWRPHVGVPFPLFDSFVASWNCLPEGSVSAQQGPLKVPDVFALCRLATSSQASLAAFCVSCLRFAHLQCSVSFRVEGPFLWATCVQGKSKIQESRPPFQWACPVSFLRFTNVFEQAIRVHRDLISACPSAAFVMPDISVPEQCLQEPCTWTRGKMSQALLQTQHKDTSSGAMVPVGPWGPMTLIGSRLRGSVGHSHHTCLVCRRRQRHRRSQRAR